MKVPLIDILKLCLLLALGATALTHCREKPSPVNPDDVPEETATVLENEPESDLKEGPPPKLEDIIRGVWQSTNIEGLDPAPEKIQLDFRGNGELTMIIYKKGLDQLEGKYEVKGDELWLQIKGQESDAVKTTYEDETLTVIDVTNGDEVEFRKL